MLYPVVLHSDDGIQYGVTVPDIPGCFSAGESIDKALRSVKEAIESHLEILVDDGDEIPAPMSVADHVENDDYKDGIWAMVDIDISKFSMKTEKVNVTLPTRIIHLIDGQVAKGNSRSRSSFLTEAAYSRLRDM